MNVLSRCVYVFLSLYVYVLLSVCVALSIWFCDIATIVLERNMLSIRQKVQRKRFRIYIIKTTSFFYIPSVWALLTKQITIQY